MKWWAFRFQYLHKCRYGDVRKILCILHTMSNVILIDNWRFFGLPYVYCFTVVWWPLLKVTEPSTSTTLRKLEMGTWRLGKPIGYHLPEDDADKEDVYVRAERNTSHRISGYCFVTYNNFLHFSKYILRLESLWDTSVL